MSPKDRARQMMRKMDKAMEPFTKRKTVRECVLVAIYFLQKEEEIFTASKGYWEEVKKELLKLDI